MSPEELLELSQRLSQEKLYTQTERENILRLNQDVSVAATQVCKTAWLVKQQLTNLSRITQDEASLCCLKANVLESTNFVDAFHHLNYHESKFSSFLKSLRDDPTLVVELVVSYSCTNIPLFETIDTLMGAVYGSCVSAREEVLVATMLSKLAERLLGNADNTADRVLTRDKCAWCQIYRSYTDCLTSCKLFLAAALHQPIINLLTQDDWFYDIDPSKVLERFQPQQRMTKFGHPGTEAYNNKVKDYRQTIVRNLHRFTMDFVNHIKEAMVCFPAPLRWLISHVHQSLISTGRYNELQSHGVCAKLVFDLFICPAMIDPMLYGLTSDVTLGHIARHNLIQVARILQVLSKGQRSEEKSRVPDLYSLFEEDCLVTVMSSILQPEPSQTLRLHGTNLFNRTSIFIGTQQLESLVTAFKDTLAAQPEDSTFRQRGEALVKPLPNLKLNPTTVSPVTTPSHSPQIKSKRRHVKKLSHVDVAGALSNIPTFNAQEVLSIAVDDVSAVGLMEEERVLSSLAESRDSTASRIDGAMKKTRFYLAQDQESIGNVSEYQASELADAISEAASVRSERSTNLDDGEDVDDNLSDMVSANVSGRGSPNISGRETPQSMGDGGTGGGAANPPNLPVTVSKPNNDLTDRFGKFAIETRVDRAIDNRSLVSDSWSTDVYASDSEPPESQYEPAEPALIPEMISETASESAWSTDVLNSDTSERPSDRLGELDQIDESLVGIDQGNESDAMSTLSMDSRRGEPNSPFVPVRQQPGAAASQAQPFPFAAGQGSIQPAFHDASSDARRLDVGRLNHSSGSSFITTQNGTQFVPLANSTQPAGQLSNQIGAMAPLQPIRTHGAAGHNNVLDMFDPLNEDLPTPPIRQVENTQWASGEPSTPPNLPKAAWQPANRQAQASDAVSNWSRGGANHESHNPWSASPKPAPGGAWNASAQPSNWTTNQGAARLSPTNQNQESKSDDVWVSSDQGAARPRTWDSPGGAHPRLPSGSSNRFAVIEDEVADSSSRPTSWAHPTQAKNAITVTSISTTTQSGAGNSLAGVTSVTTAAGGAIPKRPLPRTNSQGSTNEEVDNSLLLPGKKLGKERKGGVINNIFTKGRRGRASGKASPMRQMDKSDRSSPAISEPRDEVASSASDDSSKLKRSEVRRDSEKSEKAESSDDILEKYRTSSGSKQRGAATTSPSTGPDEPDEPSTPIYDPDNLEKCLAFADAKKKLRLVLSTPALYSISLLSMYRQLDMASVRSSNENFLVQYLQVLHSEAILHQDLQLVTQIQETVRCLQRFNNSGCRKLVRAIREEYQSRVHYISYLAKARHQLLSMQARIQGMLLTLTRDKESCFNSLIQECVRIFLDKKEAILKRLQVEFPRLQSPDEKAAELERCLKKLCSEIDRDEMWNGANAMMREAAQLAIERGVMEKVYKLAMFPNADGDTQRDKIYTENVARLALTVTPSHKQLKIPSVYHLEAPWSSAQAHLIKINAFKTPKEKVQCVCLCVDTIMGLLRMAHTKSVPGADDFLPVFIYVLIMANPPNLLSSIQYVDSLYGSRMEGEEAYNWTQLNTAVSFIKMWLQDSMVDDKNA